MEWIVAPRQLPALHLHHQGASWRVVVETDPDLWTADDHQKMEWIAAARQLPALHLHHQDVSWRVAVEISPDPGTVAVLPME